MEQETDNLYKPPAAELRSNLNTAGNIPDFYVVSGRKYLILAIGTLGLYFLYWFYRHWKNQKLLLNERTLPVLRSVFAVFFTHALFGRIQKALDAKELQFSWNSMLMATVFVIASIVQYVITILDPNSEIPSFTLASLFMMVPLVYAAYRAQQAANVVCDDASGAQNSRLTWANYIWLLIGALLWLGVIFSLLFLTFGDPVLMMLQETE